jgi:hypothetical protein
MDAIAICFLLAMLTAVPCWATWLVTSIDYSDRLDSAVFEAIDRTRNDTSDTWRQELVERGFAARVDGDFRWKTRREVAMDLLNDDMDMDAE